MRPMRPACKPESTLAGERWRRYAYASVLHARPRRSPGIVRALSLGLALVVCAVSEPRAHAAPPPAAVQAFELPEAALDDPYGPRPPTAPRLSLDQITAYALQNPLIEAAEAEIEARQADLDRARFAWIPSIKSSVWLSPGANIRCDDVALAQVGPDGAPLLDPSTGNPQAFDFQYCRPGTDADLDIQTIQGYFAQLAEAGIFLKVQAEFVIPIYTFGRILAAKKLAKIAHVVAELEREQARVETLRRVHQAHATLLLARASLNILDEAWRFLQTERERIERTSAPAWDADPEEFTDDADPADLFELEIGELELASRVRDARSLEAGALSILWALCGDAAPVGFDIASDEVRLERLDGGLRPLAHYQALAQKHRPEARLAEAGVAAVQLQERLARSAFLPNIGLAVKATLGYGNRAEQVPALYYSRRLNYGAINFGLAMNWDLDFHTKTFGLRKARARTRRAQHQRDAAMLMMAVEIDKARRAVSDASERMAIVDAARSRSWSLVLEQRARQTVGGGDFSKLRDALKQWAEFEFRHLQAVSDHNVAVVKLSRVVGLSLSTTPDAPSVPTKEGPSGDDRPSVLPDGLPATGDDGLTTPPPAPSTGTSSAAQQVPPAPTGDTAATADTSE